MRFFRQIIRIFLLCCLGDLISIFLPFPFPGSVLALIFLFFCLTTKTIRPDQVDLICDFLLRNMSFIFLPSTVSLVSYLDILTPVLWKFLTVCIISTAATFLSTAFSASLTMYLSKKLSERKTKIE